MTSLYHLIHEIRLIYLVVTLFPYPYGETSLIHKNLFMACQKIVTNITGSKTHMEKELIHLS